MSARTASPVQVEPISGEGAGAKTGRALVYPLICDSEPLRVFIALLERVLQAEGRGVEFGDLSGDLVRAETDMRLDAAGVIAVQLYPSERLVRLAADVLEGR
jgi:hypothetical protein